MPGSGPSRSSTSSCVNRKLARCAQIFVPGATRRLVSFFCLPKSKVPKKRAPHSVAPAGFPALLAKPGGCGTRPLASDSPRRLPPALLRYSATEKGNEKKQNTKPNSLSGQSPDRPRQNNTRNARDFAFFEIPLLRRFVWAGQAGGSGEHCLSSAAACGLCKLSGRLRSPRLSGSDEGIPKGRRSGVAFFWVTFSWPHKKR